MRNEQRDNRLCFVRRPKPIRELVDDLDLAARVAELCRSFEYAERPCEAAVVKAAQLRVHDVLSYSISFVFRVAAGNQRAFR